MPSNEDDELYKCQFKHYHGCCRKTNQSMHFDFGRKQTANNNIKISFTRKLLNKNITILGDSIQQQLFEGLSEILDLSWKQKTVSSFRRNNRNAELHTLHHKSNGWLQYLKFFLFSNNTQGCNTISKTMSINESVIKAVLSISDIIIANLGIHYFSCSVKAYGESLRLFSDILKKEILKYNKKQVILRGTLPQHFPSKDNTGFFEVFNPEVPCSKVPSFIENYTNTLLKSASVSNGLKYLNNYFIYRERFDLHSTTKKGDCTHYCYSPELILAEMFLLNEMIK